MEKWCHATILLLIFLVGSLVCPFCLPIGGWSDGRSHWGAPCAIFVLSSALAIATHWLYRSSGTLYKVQACVLWLFFGAVAAIAGYKFVLAVLFITIQMRYG